MTGTDRLCGKAVVRAAWGIMLGAATAFAQSGAPPGERHSGGPPVDRFSAALADELPPNRYGGYQFSDSYQRARDGYNYQYARPIPHEAESQWGHTGAASEEHGLPGGHGEVRPVQYPLSNESVDELDRIAPSGPPAPSFMPPTLVPHEGPIPTSAPGGGVTADFLGDLTHVAGSGNSLGITTLTGRMVLETPRLPGVSFRPHFGWHWLNGPRRTDLPGQLYDISLEGRMYWPFHDRLIGEFALAPSIFTDFENTSSDALRIVGRGVGYFLWSPDVRFAAGATYLDRNDILVLPIAGVIWTPTPDHRLELLFPQPRIAHCYRRDASHERWIYVSGELGGGSWAIQRSTGQDDVVSYRDLRLITGIEWKYTNKSSWRIEGGYVFGRELEYESHVGDYDPTSTSMLRAAIVY
ncbi:MAG: hypothetical protein KF861_03025 [Planctomycetaceae bacterium]|nr:hypothetical protein [Planctomycetaceae bacterium]